MYNKESHDTIDERTFVFQDKDYTILHWFSRTAFTGRAGNFCFQNKKPARQQDGADEAKQKAGNKRSRRKQEAERKPAQTETRNRCSKRKKPEPPETKRRSGKTAQTKAKTGAAALQNPKGAILKAMRKTGALNFQKQPGITPYDRARRKTAKKPRPKQAETD